MPAHDDEIKTPRAELLGHEYEKIVFCRNLLRWVHVLLAIATAFMFLSAQDYSHFAWWHRGSGTIQLFRIVIPVSPFAISGILASNFDTAASARVYAFCVTLALGTGAFGWIYISHWAEAFSNWLDIPFLFALLVFCSAQLALFVLAANIFLDVDIQPPINPPGSEF
jgi:hypothetical protein